VDDEGILKFWNSRFQGESDTRVELDQEVEGLLVHFIAAALDDYSPKALDAIELPRRHHNMKLKLFFCTLTVLILIEWEVLVGLASLAGIGREFLRWVTLHSTLIRRGQVVRQQPQYLLLRHVQQQEEAVNAAESLSCSACENWITCVYLDCVVHDVVIEEVEKVLLGDYFKTLLVQIANFLKEPVEEVWVWLEHLKAHHFCPHCT
jgi:hypothetical protein